MKKFVSLLIVLALALSVCSVSLADESVADVIAQAQTMTNEELYKKAIEESNGKVLYGIGNSSRGKSAGASFIEMLKGIDPNYTGTIDWSQPKNNSIFTVSAAWGDWTDDQHVELFLTGITEGYAEIVISFTDIRSDASVTIPIIVLPGDPDNTTETGETP